MNKRGKLDFPLRFREDTSNAEKGNYETARFQQIINVVRKVNRQVINQIGKKSGEVN